MKKSAVEWLVQEITDLIPNNIGSQLKFKNKIEQAKEIEKEQQGRSDKEVKKLIVDFLFTKGIGREVGSVNEWFEQFKKK